MAKHENAKSWANATAANVTQTGNAVSSLRQVLEQLQKKDIVDNVDTDSRSRLMKGTAEVDTIDSRIEEVKESVKKIGDQYLRIQYEFRIKWGQLKVCEQRLESRAKRPESEHFKDHLNEALEYERKVLKESRLELQTHAKDAMKVQAELQVVCGYLNRDVAHKRTPATHLGKHPRKSASVPQLPQIKNNLDNLTVAEDPVLSKLKAPELIKTALEREERAEKVCRKSSEVMLRVSGICAQALARVVASMEKRCIEVGDLKKQLYEQLQEANGTVADAERVLQRMEMQDRLRQEAAAAAMEEPPQPNPAKEQKMKAAQKFLADLKAARLKVEEDYRNKTASLKVEESCKSLIAGRVDARTPGQKSKSIKARSESGKVPVSPSGNTLPPTSPSAALPPTSPASPAAAGNASPVKGAAKDATKEPAPATA